MRRALWQGLYALALLVYSTGSVAQEPSATGEAKAKDVRSLHAAYYRTLTTEGPQAALDRYYADDYTYVGVDGLLIDKAGLSARMKRNELQHFTLEDDLKRVSVYGDVVVLSGHSKSSFTDKGQNKTSVEGYTEVWARRGGKWKLVAEQITPQPD